MKRSTIVFMLIAVFVAGGLIVMGLVDYAMAKDEKEAEQPSGQGQVQPSPEAPQGYCAPSGCCGGGYYGGGRGMRGYGWRGGNSAQPQAGPGWWCPGYWFSPQAPQPQK